MLADQVFGGFINTGPPNDFAIGIGYSDGGLTAPTAVAVDLVASLFGKSTLMRRETAALPLLRAV